MIQIKFQIFLKAKIMAKLLPQFQLGLNLLLAANPKLTLFSVLNLG